MGKPRESLVAVFGMGTTPGGQLRREPGGNWRGRGRSFAAALSTIFPLLRPGQASGRLGVQRRSEVRAAVELAGACQVRPGRTVAVALALGVLLPVVAAPSSRAAAQSEASKPRTWTDSTGKFTVEATLIEAKDDQVNLKRSDGKIVTLPMDRLTHTDQEFAQEAVEESTVAGDSPSDAEANADHDKSPTPQSVEDGRPPPSATEPLLPLVTLTDFDETVRFVAFTPDGRKLIAAGHGKIVRVFDTQTGRLLRKLKGHEGGVESGAVSPDGKMLATGSWDKTIRLWNIDEGKTVGVLLGHKAATLGLAFSPDGTILVSGGADKVIRLWNPTTATELKSLPPQEKPIYGIAISPDGKIFASASGDYKNPQETGQIMLWDLATGEHLQTLPDYGTWYFSVGFTENGKALLFSDAQGHVRLWDVIRRRLVAEMECERQANAMALIGPGNLLAVGGRPGTISIWDVSTRERVATCQGHDGVIHGIASSPDGTAIASGGTDNTVKIWSTPNDQRSDATLAGQIRRWPERISRADLLVLVGVAGGVIACLVISALAAIKYKSAIWRFTRNFGALVRPRLFSKRRGRAEGSAANARPRIGFTLVELLVVIGIIGILIALLLPAVMAARGAARRAHCANNLKQIGLAMHNYQTVHGSLPPGGITYGPWASAIIFTSWPIAILPYVEQEKLYDRYHPGCRNEAPENAEVRETIVPVYACPADVKADRLEPPSSGPGKGINYRGGSYRGMGGRSDGTAWWDSDGFGTLPANWIGVLHVVRPGIGCETLDHIRDGTSNTLMIGEYHTRTHTNRGTFWAYTYASYNRSDATLEPLTMVPDYDACDAEADENACKRGWASFHSGGSGLNFLACDGSVRFVSRTIDMELFCQLATIRGGEPAQMP